MSCHQHYDTLLARHYSWMLGGNDAAVSRNRMFFADQGIVPKGNARALDLGCGSGAQAIPLAEAGFSVEALDMSADLLKELKQTSGNLPIRTLQADMLRFAEHVSGPFELITCMGDTLPHLGSMEDVHHLFHQAAQSLESGGMFLATFRDLGHPLEGTDRILPVRMDDDRLFTCFLEDDGDGVWVHDVVHERADGAWSMSKSRYRKLKIAPQTAMDLLRGYGLEPELAQGPAGFQILRGRKA